MSCEMHRECARDHYQVDKARAIRDEDRMTGRSNFSRVCEKCGLERESVDKAKEKGFEQRSKPDAEREGFEPSIPFRGMRP